MKMEDGIGGMMVAMVTVEEMVEMLAEMMVAMAAEVETSNGGE
jgi:hypothetical protein